VNLPFFGASWRAHAFSVLQLKLPLAAAAPLSPLLARDATVVIVALEDHSPSTPATARDPTQLPSRPYPVHNVPSASRIPPKSIWFKDYA
jgi:hypothetical protein